MSEKTRRLVPELDITVATGGQGGLSLANEVALTKAALLYADRVTLASPRIALMQGLTALLNEPDSIKRDPVLRLALQFLTPERAPGLAWTRVRRARALLSAAEFDEAIMLLRAEIGAEDLEYAIKRGALVVDALGFDPRELVELSLEVSVRHRLGLHGNTRRGKSLERMVRHPRVARVIRDLLKVDSPTYPLFDKSAGDLARFFVRNHWPGVAPGRAAVRSAKHAAMAAHTIGLMEAFPDATMPDILEARSLLAGPLVRFRAAIGTVAKMLEAAPFDSDFRAAADEVYRCEIAPQLLDLDELARELKLLSQLRRAVEAGKGVKPAVAAIGFVVTLGSSMPELLVAATTGGILTSAVAEVGQGMLAGRRETQSKQSKNSFLFLYEANRRLGKGGHGRRR